MQRLFLIGGLTGILLSGLLNNHYEKRTSIGSGLLIYIIFMFLSYLIMKAWELHTSKKLSGKKIIVYLSRISFGFILIGLLFSSFLRINYNDQSNYNANTNYRLTDVIDLSFYTESRSPFNLMSVIPWKVYSERVYEFADYPETDNSDIRSKLNSMDLTILPFSVFVGVEPVVQTILLGITTILAILSIGLSLLMQYVVMIDRDYKKRKLRRNLQILITILIGVLIGISIFMKIKMNYSNTVGYSNLSAHVSTGLVIAFFVSVAIVIYEKHRLKIKKVT